MIWVPPGFAHGFYVMSDEAEFSYKCTDYYAPSMSAVFFGTIQISALSGLWTKSRFYPQKMNRLQTWHQRRYSNEGSDLRGTGSWDGNYSGHVRTVSV